MNTSIILITCAKGISPVLSNELRTLGFPITSEQTAGVETRGTFEDAIRLNLMIRTGHRVLLLFREFRARTADELYRQVYAMPWEEVIPRSGYFSVTSSVETDAIRDSRFASLKCKDAIADRMKEKTGGRPDSGPERDRTVLHLYWKGDRGAVYLDTSGEPLSRRGYRKIPLDAPMLETLAAAVVLSTGWNGEGNFINPFCGSGTLAIEAALIGLCRQPGLLRSNFGFMHLQGFSEAAWRELREQVRQASRASLPGKIIATDIDPKAVRAAEKNAETAGVAHLIEFGVCDFRDTPLAGIGTVVMNPPYGERMGDAEQLAGLYKGIGDFLKQECEGFSAFVFTGNAALAKKISLKPKRTMPFFNSGIECRLLEYELYEGTRKIKKGKKQA